MLYLIAIIFPPLAVLLAGKPVQSVLNLVLTLFFYVPGLIHALLVVHDKKADKRMKQQTAIISKSKQTTK
ncbi:MULTISPECIES: YqaE/Pmp3 family membrane protein [Peribacillus]|uniref:YqaE/Pmp3 family membrane protein n=1 Tax=Peribacillus TaxID=2675229 RepID=UPI003305D7BF